MVKSTVIQRWQAEAHHKAILALLNNRFNAVPGEVTRQLQTIQNQKKLIALTIWAVDCTDLDSFSEAMSA